MDYLKDFLIGFGEGIKIAVEWYIRRIRENWWWIFFAIIDILLIPLKLIVTIPLSIISIWNSKLRTFLVNLLYFDLIN